MPPVRFSDEAVRQAFPQIEWLGTSIDSGGQKQVFECRVGGSTFALKILPPPTSPDHDDYDVLLTEMLARAEREVDTLQKCDSPHLVKAGPIALTRTQVGGTEVAVYSEEWIVGETIAQIGQRQSLFDFVDVIVLAQSMAKAIGEISALNKIHRDIKPGNIMKRSSDNSFVLLDLGMAFDLDDISLTRSGFVVGTPGYWSPEQLDPTRRRDIDFRSDLFSLGIVLYIMLTGVHPFMLTVADRRTVMENILFRNPPVIHSLRNDTPAHLERIVTRLLAKVPARRYRTIQQLLDDLASVK